MGYQHDMVYNIFRTFAAVADLMPVKIIIIIIIIFYLPPSNPSFIYYSFIGTLWYYYYVNNNSLSFTVITCFVIRRQQPATAAAASTRPPTTTTPPLLASEKKLLLLNRKNHRVSSRVTSSLGCTRQPFLLSPRHSAYFTNCPATHTQLASTSSYSSCISINSTHNSHYNLQI